MVTHTRVRFSIGYPQGTECSGNVKVCLRNIKIIVSMVTDIEGCYADGSPIGLVKCCCMNENIYRVTDAGADNPPKYSKGLQDRIPYPILSMNMAPRHYN